MVSKAGIEPAKTGSLDQRVCQLRHLDIVAVDVLPLVLPEGFEPSKMCGLSALCLPIPPEEHNGGRSRVRTCDTRVNGPLLCLLSYTPTEVADNALPGVVRSREVESRTCRLKVGYSAS